MSAERRATEPQFTERVRKLIAETDTNYLLDLAALRLGRETPATLLAELVRGASIERATGWLEYVDELSRLLRCDP